MPTNVPATLGGIGWIVSALLIGYLALLQLGYSGFAAQVGVSASDLQSLALWNGITAAVTVYFAVRLLMNPDRGILLTSAGWAALSVVWGVYQVANGATNDAFLGSVVAAGAAGVLSIAARPAAPLSKRERKREQERGKPIVK